MCSSDLDRQKDKDQPDDFIPLDLARQKIVKKGFQGVEDRISIGGRDPKFLLHPLSLGDEGIEPGTPEQKDAELGKQPVLERRPLR